MNASATMRATYVRASIMPAYHQRHISQVRGMRPITELQTRAPQERKLSDFKPVDYLQHREDCEKERATQTSEVMDVEKGASFMDLEEAEGLTFREQLRRMYTKFPYRDPIWIVAVVFAVGSLDLVVNAFFDLLPRAEPSTHFAGEEEIAVPTTVLIGAILFFLAGIMDSFAALNADRGTLSTSKDPTSQTLSTEYRPALLGSAEWSWIPPLSKFLELASHNLAFQAGLLVLVGGFIFMFGGVTDFPNIVPESSEGLLVFAPQVIHGAVFFVANLMLAISEQDRWWKPKFASSDWQGALLNSIGGLGFMLAGLFLFQEEQEEKSAIAALVGSFAFLVGSLIRWFVVMEFC